MPDVRAGSEVQVRGRYNATPPALNDQDTAELQLDSVGDLKVVLSGTSTVYSYIQGTADGSTLQAVVRKINAESALITHDPKIRDILDEFLLTVKTALEELTGFDINAPSDSNSSASTYRIISLASTNADVLSTGLTNINGWYFFNTSGSTKYVKLYNLNRVPIVGTDKPTLTLPIPAGGAANVLNEDGIYFSQGVAIAITGALADSDATNVAAGDVIANVFYTSPADNKSFLTYRVISLATTNADQISSSPGNLNGYYIFNTSAGTKFIKLYNLNRAPIVGTDKPALTIPLPAGGGANIMDKSGILFSQGIGIAVTGAAADSDTTAVAAGDVVINMFYSPLQEID